MNYIYVNHGVNQPKNTTKLAFVDLSVCIRIAPILTMTRLDMAYVPVMFPTTELIQKLNFYLLELVDLLKTKIHLSVSERSLNSEELFVVFGS